MAIGEPLMLFDLGAALVREPSVSGLTGPIAGQRTRLSVVPSYGDLRMTTLDLDFRQYAMPVRPVTVAARLLHVGRYGTSAEDQRLFPLYLGDSTLVRGYDVNSFGPRSARRRHSAVASSSIACSAVACSCSTERSAHPRSGCSLICLLRHRCRLEPASELALQKSVGPMDLERGRRRACVNAPGYLIAEFYLARGASARTPTLMVTSVTMISSTCQ